MTYAYFFSNALIFLDFGYKWYFMLSLLKYLYKKYRIMVHYWDPLQKKKKYIYILYIYIIAPWRFTHFLDNFSIFRNFSLKFSKALLNKDIIKRIYLFPTGFDTKSSSGNLNDQIDKNYWKLRSFKLAGTFWYLPTNSGEALNYKSECSEKYKKGFHHQFAPQRIQNIIQYRNI